MTFNDFNLNKPLLSALDDLGIHTPTSIQAKTFSPIMAGKNVVGIAQTGTGKTFAFLLPALRLWKFTHSPHPQIMIIVPTRELVAQVVAEVEKLTTYMNIKAVGVYGGTSMRRQKEAVGAGADVIVGTPGRLNDLLLDGVLKAKLINRLIIDEVDEMLNLGFRTQLKNIVEFLPKKRQHLMFSATLTEEVEYVIDYFANHYEKIEAAPSGAPLENINQSAYQIPNFNSKASLLTVLLNENPDMTKVLVFAGTKKMADRLYEKLSPDFEENMGVIHSSKSQNNRFKTVDKFQDGTYRFLIATDIIARGLDVSAVTHVVNFDLTDTAEKYIHRIGRTGRAEKKGIAISFVSEKEEVYKQQIEELMSLKIPVLPLPENVELSEELIDLEMPIEHNPFNNNKMKQFVPSESGAFQEKKEKNKKVNKKIRYEELMKQKYKNPRTRGQKPRGKKKR